MNLVAMDYRYEFKFRILHKMVYFSVAFWISFIYERVWATAENVFKRRTFVQ